MQHYAADFLAHTWLVHDGRKATKMFCAIREESPLELQWDMDVFVGCWKLPSCVEDLLAKSLLRALLQKTFEMNPN